MYIVEVYRLVGWMHLVFIPRGESGSARHTRHKRIRQEERLREIVNAPRRAQD